ncbi:MAG: hypothetical protein ACYCWW_07960 [Deltaproteobacteria bacterium]
MHVITTTEFLESQECEGLRFRVTGDRATLSVVHCTPTEPEVVVEIIGRRKGYRVIFDADAKPRIVQDGRRLSDSDLEPEALAHYAEEARLLVRVLSEVPAA